MSHKANYWLASLDPKRVKSGAFRVLFHLCDHHNMERDPSTACYPSQDTLRERTGLSNGALNEALNAMEKECLILRRQSTVPGSRERRTYYILGCDVDLSQEQTPETGVCSNSGGPEPEKEQTPDLGLSNSGFTPIKLRPTGEDPTRTFKNLTPPCASAPEEQEEEAGFSEIFYSEMLQHLGAEESGWWSGEKARSHVRRWLDLGLSQEDIIAEAKANRETFDEPPQGPKALDVAMKAAAKAKKAGKPNRAAKPTPASDDERAAFWAEKLNGKAYVSPNALTPRAAGDLIRRGLVTAETLRKRGIAFSLPNTGGAAA